MILFQLRSVNGFCRTCNFVRQLCRLDGFNRVVDRGLIGSMWVAFDLTEVERLQRGGSLVVRKSVNGFRWVHGFYRVRAFRISPIRVHGSVLIRCCRVRVGINGLSRVRGVVNGFAVSGFQGVGISHLTVNGRVRVNGFYSASLRHSTLTQPDDHHRH